MASTLAVEPNTPPMIDLGASACANTGTLVLWAGVEPKYVIVLHRNPMGNDEENAPAVRVFAFPFEHIVEDVSSDCRGAGADSHRCVGRMCDTKWFGYKWQVAGVSWGRVTTCR